jgi:uncharacterized protein DUF6570
LFEVILGSWIIPVRCRYNGIRGHVVAIPQNPGPQLDILPGPDHDDSNRMDRQYRDDLKPLAEVRKDKVIRALLWLCEHNPLYKSVRINHEPISQREDSFIPPALQEDVVHAPEDGNSDERGRQMPPTLARSHRMPFSFISISFRSYICRRHGRVI